MEAIGLDAIINIVSNLGIPGIVLVMWWLGDRSHRNTLAQYHDDMQEMRKMYENNVALVKDYSELARDLKEVVIMNTQAWQRANDSIEKNQYCPMIRLKKTAQGVQE